MDRHVEAINATFNASFNRPPHVDVCTLFTTAGGHACDTSPGITCDARCTGDSSLSNCDAQCAYYSGHSCSVTCDYQVGDPCGSTCYFYNSQGEGCNGLNPYGE